MSFITLDIAKAKLSSLVLSLINKKSFLEVFISINSSFLLDVTKNSFKSLNDILSTFLISSAYPIAACPLYSK